MIPLCGIFSLLSCLKDIVEGIVSFLFNGIWDILTEALETVMKLAVKLIVGTVGTIWIKVPTIPVADERGGQFIPTDAVNFLQGRVMWLAMALATLGVIVAGIRMAWGSRGEGVKELGKSLGTFMVVTVFGLAVATLFIRIGDALADQFITDATRTKSFDARMDDLVNGPFQDLTLPLILLLGFAMIISSIIQIGLMFVRNGMVILLLGVLPLAAAATNTEMGKAWFRRLVGWLAAFLAYKPLAALIYGAAMTMMGSATGWLDAATGIAMMVMAVIALPALLRFVSPNTGG